MSEVFFLKFRDTRPTLEVVLKNPDATVFDLTGPYVVTLIIKLNDGTVLTRPMTIFGSPTNGTVRYTWIATDWDTGKLIVGPQPPFKQSDTHHLMEYEAVYGTAKVTFPNDGWDILRIYEDLGEAP